MAFCHSDVPNNYADMKEWKKYSDPLLKRVILQFSIAILQHCQNHDGQFKKKKKSMKNNATIPEIMSFLFSIKTAMELDS